MLKNLISSLILVHWVFLELGSCISGSVPIKAILHICNLEQIAGVMVSISIQFAFYLGYLIIELGFLSIS